MAEEIKAVLTADSAAFNAELAKARAHTARFDQSMQGAMQNSRAAVNQMVSSMASARSGLLGMVNSMSPVAMAAAGMGVAAAGAKSAFEEFAKQEKLQLAMTAITGSAGDAKLRIEELREVAKRPGLGFEEAVQGDIRLRSAGLSATQSKEAIEAFANALALVGGGKEEMKGVILALSQIAAKSKVSAEEINQLAERLPQIRTAMQDAFGTADTEAIQKMGIAPKEFIEKLIQQFQKLPQAAGGAANAVDNLSDAWKGFMASVGEGESSPLVQGLQKASELLVELRKGMEGLKIGINPSEGVGNQGGTSGAAALLRQINEEMNKLKEATDRKDRGGFFAAFGATGDIEKAEAQIVKLQEKFSKLDEESRLYAQDLVKIEQLQSSGLTGDELDRQMRLIQEQNQARKDSLANERRMAEAAKAAKEEMQAQAAASKELAELREKTAAKMESNLNPWQRKDNAQGKLNNLLNDQGVSSVDDLQKNASLGSVKEQLAKTQALEKALELMEKIKQATKEASDEEQKWIDDIVKGNEVFTRAGKEQMELEKQRKQEKAALSDYQSEIEAIRLETEGQQAKADAVREEVEVRKEALSLAEATGLSEAQTVELVRQKLALQKEAAKDDSIYKELDILREEAAGHKRKADQLREEVNLRKEALDLAKKLGVTEEEATKLAKEKNSLLKKIDRRENRDNGGGGGGGGSSSGRGQDTSHRTTMRNSNGTPLSDRGYDLPGQSLTSKGDEDYAKDHGKTYGAYGKSNLDTPMKSSGYGRSLLDPKPVSLKPDTERKRAQDRAAKEAPKNDSIDAKWDRLLKYQETFAESFKKLGIV